MDPFLLPLESLDPNCLPSIEAVDLVSFLILEHSFYTKQTFKNYKSLQAYKQVVSGFVTSVKGTKINDNYIVMGEVLHSQKLKEKPVQCWIITNNDGTVLSGHCMCMAGLGECCTHIATILFYIEVWKRVTETPSCTQQQCAWIIPSGSTCNIKYEQVEDINFKSVSRLRKDLETQISKECANSSSADPIDLVAAPASAPSTNISPTKDELEKHFENLSKHKPVASILSLDEIY